MVKISPSILGLFPWTLEQSLYPQLLESNYNCENPYNALDWKLQRIAVMRFNLYWDYPFTGALLCKYSACISVCLGGESWPAACRDLPEVRTGRRGISADVFDLAKPSGSQPKRIECFFPLWADVVTRDSTAWLTFRFERAFETPFAPCALELPLTLLVF